MTVAPPRPTRGHRRTPEDQPGNTFRYLYWRLSEKEFQQLCGALLRRKFDGVQCYPVGMADGGIDATSAGGVVYQVKWTSKFQQDPASWLASTMERERDKVRRLVEAGRASRYVLITSVASTTASRGKGSIEKLESALKQYSRDLGIPVECWWQQDVDGEVDDAEDSIKWAYPEMLAGTQAIRYLILGSGVEGEAARMRETMTRVLAHQFAQDAHVRFTQVEMDGVSLADLFVDVHAALVAPPRNAMHDRQTVLEIRGGEKSKGAVRTLLDTALPLTFLVGVPGQGKSTLTQYLCQVHREVILAEEEGSEKYLPPGRTISEPKLPLRIQLKEYAAWVDGYDTFDDERPRVSRRRSKPNRSAERYIAELCAAASGGRTVTVEAIHSLLDRYPCLIVFDGLDEVADPELRSVVVDEIHAMATRMGSGPRRLRSFQIVVTSRPNATGLAEPNAAQFQRLRLQPLDESLQSEFVLKWCDARGVDGRPRQELRRIFRERKALEHVAKLADNPMQLAILLYLIHKKGDAVPVARTPLYGDYMATLLDREVAEGHIGRNAVAQVQEVTAFLGWHMQAGVETTPSAGAMTRRDIEKTLLLYLLEVGANGQDAAELFRAASDRFWALTSETDQLFEFAVQPVREYFAAKFLAEWAGRDMRQPLSKEEVLTELLGRPFWLNTARFYAGFASPNELAALLYGVDAALRSPSALVEHRVAGWALLVDAVFVGHARVQEDVARLFSEDLTLMLSQHPRFVAEFPALAPDSGGTQLARIMMRAISDAPGAALVLSRVSMLKGRTSTSKADIEAWWRDEINSAVGGPEELDWLRVGSALQIARLDDEVANRIVTSDPAIAVAALGVGSTLAADAPLTQSMLDAVLNGLASDARARATNLAGLLLTAMRPQWFHAAVAGQPQPLSSHPALTKLDESARAAAWTKLIEISPSYAALRAVSRRGQRHQKGTTELWVSSSRELGRLHGRSWLAVEIAMIAAAAPSLTGTASKERDGEPFGVSMDFGTLVSEVRRQPSGQWWGQMYDQHQDSLSRRTWALALVSAGTPEALASHLERLDAVLDSLTPSVFEATAASASRIAFNGTARSLRPIYGEEKTSWRTRLLLGQFQCRPQEYGDLPGLPDEELVARSSDAPSRWPFASALATRMHRSPSMLLLEGIARLGTNSTSAVSNDPRALEPTVATAILAEPGKFPTEWVLYAEKALRSPSAKVLERIALDKSWVPDVPRFEGKSING